MGLYCMPRVDCSSSPASRHHCPSSLGRMNRAYSWVPLGSSFNTCSAPTTANRRPWIAIDRREEDPAAGLGQLGAGADDRRWVGHVLEHLHAGDHVELGRQLLRQRLGGHLPVLDVARAGFEGMQLRHFQRLGGEVDAEHAGALARHRVGRIPPPQPTSSTRLPASPACRSIQSRRRGIDLVQRTELAVRVPPAMGEFAELGEFLRVDVAHGAMLGPAEPAQRETPPKRVSQRTGQASITFARVPTISIRWAVLHAAPGSSCSRSG